MLIGAFQAKNLVGLNLNHLGYQEMSSNERVRAGIVISVILSSLMAGQGLAPDAKGALFTNSHA